MHYLAPVSTYNIFVKRHTFNEQNQCSLNVLSSVRSLWTTFLAYQQEVLLQKDSQIEFQL